MSIDSYAHNLQESLSQLEEHANDTIAKDKTILDNDIHDLNEKIKNISETAVAQPVLQLNLLTNLKTRIETLNQSIEDVYWKKMNRGQKIISSIAWFFCRLVGKQYRASASINVNQMVQCVVLAKGQEQARVAKEEMLKKEPPGAKNIPYARLAEATLSTSQKAQLTTDTQLNQCRKNLGESPLNERPWYSVRAERPDASNSRAEFVLDLYTHKGPSKDSQIVEAPARAASLPSEGLFTKLKKGVGTFVGSTLGKVAGVVKSVSQTCGIVSGWDRSQVRISVDRSNTVTVKDMEGQLLHTFATFEKFEREYLKTMVSVKDIQRGARAANYDFPLNPVPQEPIVLNNGVQQDKAKAWVDKHDPEYREVAQAIVGATKNISFSEFNEQLLRSVNSFNASLEALPPHQRDYVIVVHPEKSTQWVAELSLKHLKYPPTNAVEGTGLRDYLQQHPDTKRIVFFDDAIYSGNQMSEECVGTAAMWLRRAQVSQATIHVVAPYMTQHGKECIRRKEEDCGFPVEFAAHAVMKTTAELIPEAQHRKLATMYFKNQIWRLDSTTPTIFDHKIADYLSTLHAVYTTGVVYTSRGQPKAAGYKVEQQRFVSNRCPPYYPRFKEFYKLHRI